MSLGLLPFFFGKWIFEKCICYRIRKSVCVKDDWPSVTEGDPKFRHVIVLSFSSSYIKLFPFCFFNSFLRDKKKPERRLLLRVDGIFLYKISHCDFRVRRSNTCVRHHSPLMQSRRWVNFHTRRQQQIEAGAHYYLSTIWVDGRCQSFFCELFYYTGFSTLSSHFSPPLNKQ